MYELSDKEHDAVLALDAFYRESYFLNKLREYDSLYIIVMNDDSGPVFLEDHDPEEGSVQILPVWCHPRFAKDYIEQEKLDARVQQVDKKVFKEQWIPVLKENEALLGLMVQKGSKFREDDFAVTEPENLLD